jgi:diguanylate cyclase (GGDEF)-like protein/PAS domain S-box-containing protein
VGLLIAARPPDLRPGRVSPRFGREHGSFCPGHKRPEPASIGSVRQHRLGGTVISTRRLFAGYAAVLIAATALYFARPAWASVAIVIASLSGIGAILVGVRRYRPRRPIPWLLIAGALLVSAAARLSYDNLPGQPGVLKPWGWTVWVLHMVMAVLLLAGVIGLVRVRIRGIAGAIDVAIIGLGAGLVTAITVAVPYARLPGTAEFVSVRVAYVVRDVLILVAALLLITMVRRNLAVLLLFSGLTGLLVFDLAVRVQLILGVYPAGQPLDFGRIAFYGAIGAAALVPSMRAIDAPRPANRSEVTPLRLIPVAVAALLPTALLVIELFALPSWTDPLVISVVAAVLILVFARLADLTARLRRQGRGERALREAIADLADVQTVADIGAALHRAVRRLLPAGAVGEVVLVNGLHVPDLAEPGPTTLLPAEVRQRVGDGFAVAIPLARDQRPQHGPTGSAIQTVDRDWPTLLVRSDRRTLGAIRGRLGVLATEATLAVERLHLAEQVIRHANEAYFRALVQNSTDVILIVDDEGSIRYASPAAETVLGTASLAGTPLAALVHPQDRVIVEQLLARSGRGPTDWTVPRAGRAPAQVEVTCVDLRHDPAVGGRVLTLRDVTEQRRLQHELVERAFQDPLTGLGNRLAFSGRLERAVSHSESADDTLAALFVDLDDLKLINDGLGHQVGDALLTRMGDRLRDFIVERPVARDAMVARLGGDEFAVLLPKVGDEGNAEQAARALVATLSQPMHVNGHELTCTASVGVATTAGDVDSSAELLRHADLALYAAKAAGKAQSYLYQPWMRDAVLDRLELRSALEHAIGNDELYLEYQPIIALDTGALTGFEALLRWRHPLRGRLAPDEFITVAEDSGLIAPVGEWVLTTAVRALASIAPADDVTYMAVNVSARQFAKGDFVSVVRRVLAETGLPPHRLLLEITESVLLRDGESTWHELERLRGLGVRIAIDDFGTGYSALSYLRHVPLDIVKLDRLFTHQMAASVRQRQLVEGIVNLTTILGLQVVAEGIETESERALALQVGCTFGQGFLFGQPMPATEARDWIAAQHAMARP